MIEESKKLVLAVISAARVLANLDDKFFKQRLFLKVSAMIDSYINFRKEDNVAQSKQSYLKFKLSTNNLLEIIDFILYSEKSKNTPLLNLKIKVLKLQLYSIKNIKDIKVKTRLIDDKVTPVTSPQNEPIKLQPIPQIYKNKTSSSKDKILDFIRRSEKIRAKDLIGEFSAFSDRTVKRILKELTDTGILKREESPDRVVYYSVVN